MDQCVIYVTITYIFNRTKILDTNICGERTYIQNYSMISNIIFIVFQQSCGCWYEDGSAYIWHSTCLR